MVRGEVASDMGASRRIATASSCILRYLRRYILIINQGRNPPVLSRKSPSGSTWAATWRANAAFSGLSRPK